MQESSQAIADSLYAHFSPADRERALANLDRYFEIVLRIFLRTEGSAQDAHNPRD